MIQRETVRGNLKIASSLDLVEKQIESDYAGTIKTCLIKNGQPVEYGQPLFVIE